MNRFVITSLVITLHFQVFGQFRHQDFIGSGHVKGIAVTASSLRETPPQRTIDGFPINSIEQLKDASRFLAQATFGADMATIQMVAAMGYEAWLEEQLSLPYSPIVDEMSEQIGRPLTRKIFHKYFRSSWITANMTSPDLLRQRLAFVWSQIMVINDNSDFYEDISQMMGYYYDQLAVNSLGNFRDLLTDVTLSPAMGNFLSHYNNHKEVPEKNIHPDENYAREIMQLFTIGLWELNRDGTLKVDDQGQPITSYTNANIKEFAQVFTGMGNGNSWGTFGVKADELADSITYIVSQPMRVYEEYHDQSEKHLLKGTILPGGQPGMDDVKQTITHLINHDNTAPFISKSLIKLLTTSNPSPKYVDDVASVFNPEEPENFKKVVKAILLHPEAREEATDDYTFGKLREPLVRLMNLLRAFPMTSNSRGDYPLDMFCFGSITGQSPMEAPSVFNFFLPEYQPPGLIEDKNLIAPEFHILNSTNSIGSINDFNFRIFDDRYMRDYCVEGVYKYEWDIPSQQADNKAFVIDFEDELSLTDDPSALVDRLDLLIANGLLEAGTKNIIEEAMAGIEDPRERIEMALYLTMISPDYAILN
ncbi:MAG: DUF1800 family protein [Bacteroidetes bacterium]|nr:DUF1800 family protein [Bacteroidota bacterium]